MVSWQWEQMVENKLGAKFSFFFFFLQTAVDFFEENWKLKIATCTQLNCTDCSKHKNMYMIHCISEDDKGGS